MDWGAAPLPVADTANCYKQFAYVGNGVMLSKNGFGNIGAEAAIDEQTAFSELDNFDEKWSSKYPKIAISWKSNLANLSTYFRYPEAVRTLIYTTNAIEGFNRQLRKVTKNKSVFPTDDSLLKILYLAMIEITKKWTGKRKDR